MHAVTLSYIYMHSLTNTSYTVQDSVNTIHVVDLLVQLSDCWHLPITLQAYSVYDEEVGYCQGLSFLSAVLLLHVSLLYFGVTQHKISRT